MSGDLSAATLAAIGIALSPVPFLLAVALLGTDGVLTRAAAFVSGEALAVGAVCAIAVFVLEGGGENSGAVSTSIASLEIAVGALLALLLAAHLRRRPRSGPPGWQTVLNDLGAGAAFAGGLAMVLVNPKNLALTLAGAAAIIHLDYSSGGQVAGVATFTALSVSVLVVLLALVKAFPSKAQGALESVLSFVLDHERVLVAVLLAVLAAFFLLRGLLDAS